MTPKDPSDLDLLREEIKEVRLLIWCLVIPLTILTAIGLVTLGQVGDALEIMRGLP